MVDVKKAFRKARKATGQRPAQTRLRTISTAKKRARPKSQKKTGTTKARAKRVAATKRVTKTISPKRTAVRKSTSKQPTRTKMKSARFRDQEKCEEVTLNLKQVEEVLDFEEPRIKDFQELRRSADQTDRDQIDNYLGVLMEVVAEKKAEASRLRREQQRVC